MLDIRFIRENAEMVAEKSRQKNYDVDIPKLLVADDQRRELLQKVEDLRQKRNELAGSAKGQKPSEEQLAEGRKLKDDLIAAEKRLAEVEQEFISRLKQVPNLPADDVPFGASEDENVVAKIWGDKPTFKFQPKTHWQIAESRGLIDKERAAKVAGARFAYIKGDLVKLQFAIMQYVIETLTDETTLKKIIQQNDLKVSAKPFIPILPPALIKTDVFDAMDRLEPREDRYKAGEPEDDLWLQGSAEHTIGPMHMGELLDAQDLPLRYIGFLTSFRREAGTYGKDTEGIIRMHQFDKLEMESFTLPADGLQEHLFMIAIQEYLTQALNLPYHVLQKCTADIGKPNARGVDIEMWMPGQDKYRETHTADFMTDYQARRLMTRAKTADGQSLFVHTNDATAFAMGRTMVAIMENYQQADGTFGVPKVLQPFMAGQTAI